MTQLTVYEQQPNHFYEVKVDIVPKDMDDWCEQAFPQDVAKRLDYTWYGGCVTDRTFQFRFERDLMAFVLRWS